MSERLALNREEAAEVAGISLTLARTLVARGEFPHHRISGDRIIVSRRALDDWLYQRSLAGLADGQADRPSVPVAAAVAAKAPPQARLRVHDED
jgi:excisionase family DNA binding protein